MPTYISIPRKYPNSTNRPPLSTVSIPLILNDPKPNTASRTIMEELLLVVSVVGSMVTIGRFLYDYRYAMRRKLTCGCVPDPSSSPLRDVVSPTPVSCSSPLHSPSPSSPSSRPSPRPSPSPPSRPVLKTAASPPSECPAGCQ